MIFEHCGMIRVSLWQRTGQCHHVRHLCLLALRSLVKRKILWRHYKTEGMKTNIFSLKCYCICKNDILTHTEQNHTDDTMLLFALQWLWNEPVTASLITTTIQGFLSLTTRVNIVAGQIMCSEESVISLKTVCHKIGSIPLTMIELHTTVYLLKT